MVTNHFLTGMILQVGLILPQLETKPEALPAAADFRWSDVELHGEKGRFWVLVLTSPETNSSHLKMDGWKTTFLLGFGLFSGANCEFRGG